MEYAPVCGCDKKTYGNRCGAFGAGQSYRFVGECENPPQAQQQPSQQPPQPLAPEDVSGPAVQQKEEGRGRRLGWTDVSSLFAASADLLSFRCRPEGEGDKQPAAAPMPANEEGAAGAAAAVLGGETTRVRCGSRGLPPCEDGFFCEFVDGLCGETDTGGFCSKPPLGCPKIYRPACGCDGVTYSNACMARSQGVSIRHEGDCASQDGPLGGMPTGPTTPRVVEGASTAPNQESCGGLMGKGCPASQHCIYAMEAMCGAADQTGVCMEPPAMCTLNYQPVCGCDGNTYSNACHAHAKGISVVSEGPCNAPHTPEEAVAQEMKQKDAMLASLRKHEPEDVLDAGDNGGL